MYLRLKNLKLRPLISHLIITLLYPAVKAMGSPEGKLLIFTDAVTIVGLVLLIGGVVYSFVLHGDLDIAGFALKRGVQSGSAQTFDAYMADKKEKREEAFNYPLFVGLVYLAAAALLAWLFL
jgi:hypothetical protein